MKIVYFTSPLKSKTVFTSFARPRNALNFSAGQSPPSEKEMDYKRPSRRRRSLRRRSTSRFSSVRRRTLSLDAYIQIFVAGTSTRCRAEDDPRDQQTRWSMKPPRAHTYLPPAGGTLRFTRRIGDSRRSSTPSWKSRTQSLRGPAGSHVNFLL